MHDWTYSLVTSLEFTITTDNTNVADLWGVMNVIVSIRLCHPYCKACYGDGWSNVCTACDYNKELAKLSSTTCSKTCAPGYGDNTTNPSVCILCETLCRYCVVYRYCPQFISLILTLIFNNIFLMILIF